MGKVIQFPRTKRPHHSEPNKGAMAVYELALSREIADLVIPPWVRDIGKTLTKIYPGIL